MDISDLIEEGKIKRFFRARNKLDFEGAVHHITQRAPGKEPLFLEEADYLYMLHLMKSGVKKFNYEIFSFALMPNHVHLLIRLNKANLSLGMKNLFEKYAKYFNKKYERKGPVFCKPYRAALCLDDTYLLAASVYIHLNPVKAGLVKNPSSHRWSSCSLYTGKGEPETFINYRFVLGVLDPDIRKAKILYENTLEAMKGIKAKDVLEDRKGLTFFKEKVFEYIRQSFPNERAERIGGRETLRDEDIERKIYDLSAKKRLNKPQDIQARKFLIEQLISRGYTMTEIAQKLNISRAGVYKTINLTR